MSSNRPGFGPQVISKPMREDASELERMSLPMKDYEVRAANFSLVKHPFTTDREDRTGDETIRFLKKSKIPKRNLCYI